MSKPKKRIGLQKDFSKIFDGVWVPQRPGQEQVQANGGRAVETPISDDKERGVGTSMSAEQESAIRTAPSEGHGFAGGMPAFKVPDRTAGGATLDKQVRDDDAATLREHYREIEKIMASMKCPKGFVCYRSGFRDLCKVNSVGEGKIIECSPENRGPCVYRFSFAGRVFCKCALRYYIARNLKR
jgi:hypothetical protein